MNFKLKPFRAVIGIYEQTREQVEEVDYDITGEISAAQYVLSLGAIPFILPVLEAQQDFAVISEGDYPFGNGFTIKISQKQLQDHSYPCCELCLIFPGSAYRSESTHNDHPLPAEVNPVTPLVIRKSISIDFASNGTCIGFGSVNPEVSFNL
jgi:hypothetical protein